MTSDLKIFKRQESTHFSISIETLEKLLPHMKADVVFQAGRFKRWTPELQSEYIGSIITGEAPSDIVVSDNEACMMYWKDLSKSDWEYYKAWLMGENDGHQIKFLIVDGHNRKVTIEEFLSGKVIIPSGYYDVTYIIKNNDGYDEEMTFRGNIDSNNNTFATMPEALRRIFVKLPVTITSYTNSSRDELSDLFIQINSGKVLNEAERRNAKTSQVAAVARDAATEYGHLLTTDKFRKWIKEDQVNRRGIDAYFARMLYMFFAGDIKANPNDENLWEMYGVDSPQDKNYKKGKVVLEKFIKDILSNGLLKGIPHKNALMDLWLIYLDEINSNREFIPEKILGMLKDYIVVISDLAKDPTLHESLDGFTTWKDPKSFVTIIGGLQPQNTVLRNKLITEKFDVTQYTRPKRRRTVSNWEKLEVAVESDFKTPEGLDIDISKLQTGEYHKGHVEPFAHGGETTVENTVIQTAKDNKRLGAKPVEVK